MPRPFAQHYDDIYADKNYQRDIEVFEQLAGAAPLANKHVLELGAGTGNHSFRLAPKVSRLVSIEIDTDFAAILRAKLAGAAMPNIAFFDDPVEKLSEMGFDAAVAFFHVLNYIGPQQLTMFLNGLAARLKPGACFVGDLWNGAAALLDPPRAETRQKNFADKSVTQEIRPTLDRARHTVTLDYEIEIAAGGRSERFSERILLYLWQREEWVSAFARAGFSQVNFWDYQLFPQPAGPQSWRLWLRAIRD
jgi:SAM-dependent methyltransferase